MQIQADPLSTTFAALADPTRRAILARLARGEATVTELAAPFDLSLPGDLEAPQGAAAGRARSSRGARPSGGRAGSSRRRCGTWRTGSASTGATGRRASIASTTTSASYRRRSTSDDPGTRLTRRDRKEHTMAVQQLGNERTTVYTDGLELVLERVFDAPRDLVWKVMKDPDAGHPLVGAPRLHDDGRGDGCPSRRPLALHQPHHGRRGRPVQGRIPRGRAAGADRPDVHRRRPGLRRRGRRSRR